MKKKKREIKKLSIIDHTLYLFSYVILFPLLFPLPWLMFMRNKFFLRSTKSLALSSGYGLLWIIPCMILSAILIGYIIYCDSKKIAFSNSIKKIFHSKLKLFIMIFCFVGIILSLSLSFVSSRVELTDEQITKYNILGIKTRVFDVEDVEKVEFVLDSTYISSGRYGKNTISLSYCVYIESDCIEFNSYKIEDLFSIDQIFIGKPHIITNEIYLDKWLADLNCSQEVKSSIEKIFEK